MIITHRTLISWFPLALSLAVLLTPQQARGQWTTAHLSEPRQELAATSANGQAFFAGGVGAQGFSRVVDVYEYATGSWSNMLLSQARAQLAATTWSNTVMFAGGLGSGGALSTVDAYDSSSGTWSSMHLSQGRARLAAVTVGPFSLFAGGVISGIGPVSRVDVYDNATGAWSIANLSSPNARPVAVAIGNRAYIAGSTDVVDVFDSSTGLWSTTTLSYGRTGLSSTAVGTRALFVGGYQSDRADILDTTSMSWSIASLAQSRYSPAATSIGSLAIFGGGQGGSGVFYDTVDIYDSISHTWSVSALSQGRIELTATSVGNKALFAGGGRFVPGQQAFSDRVDIYTAFPDCNNNSTPDSGDIASGASHDCNVNLIPDECDLSSGFSTDMDNDGVPDECMATIAPFCFGDGLDANLTTTCPCANFGSPGHGCASSFNASGARLIGGGQPIADSVVLLGSGMPPSSLCIYLQGDTLDDAVFGDGIRCAGGYLTRLWPKINVAGASSFPDGTEGYTLSQRGSVTPGSGATRYYQTYYRNASAAFCPPAQFNVTNGVTITW